MRAGRVSEVLAHFAHCKLMRPLCPGGEEGLSGGSAQDRLLFGPSSLSVGVYLLLNRSLTAPPRTAVSEMQRFLALSACFSWGGWRPGSGLDHSVSEELGELRGWGGSCIRAK